jgi:sec-independent protein translocase protein TatA
MFTLPLAFGMPGPTEMIVIGAGLLLVFGNRLPSVMRSLGKSVTEFKKGINEVGEDLDSAGTADKKPAATVTTQPTSHD